MNDARYNELLSLIAQLRAGLPANPIVVGTATGQSGAGFSYVVYATTTDTTPAVVDTGYLVADGHSAKIDGGYSATDRTAHTVRIKNIAVALRNYGGLVVAGQFVSGSFGDAALANANMSFGVSGGGTFEITFTPPGDYSGVIDWLLTFGSEEN
jgi:hypothetical protein